MSEDRTSQDLGETSVWTHSSPCQHESGRRAWLTVLSGSETGRVYSLRPGTWTLGRSSKADITLSDTEVSRMHLEIDVREQGTATVRDTKSTNGTLIGSRSLSEAPVDLRDGAKLQVGGALVLRFSFRDRVEERFERKLYDTLTRDALTGVYNKRYFELRLEQEFAHAKRHARGLGLVMIDLDDFKEINDTKGHAAGDHALSTVAGILDDALREEELIARYGGEEFCVLLRETTREEALLCAERLRRVIFGADVRWEGSPIHLSASLGVALTYGAGLDTAEQLFIEADDYLYRAKNSGKNRVCGPPRAA